MKLTLEDMLAFYREHVAADAPQRRKLSVHSVPEAMAASAPLLEAASATYISDVGRFKQSLSLLPRVVSSQPVASAAHLEAHL
jgi:hypothetical protein